MQLEAFIRANVAASVGSIVNRGKNGQELRRTVKLGRSFMIVHQFQREFKGTHLSAKLAKDSEVKNF